MPAPAAPDQPGVTRALAIERGARVSHVATALTLRIPEDPDLVSGSLVTTFLLRAPDAPLAIDFAPGHGAVHALSINGHRTEPSGTPGRLVLAGRLLVPGPNTVACDFTSGGAGLHRRRDLVYSLFVPNLASHVFPCFDQPDIRVRWTLTLDLPLGWRAVSNSGVNRQSSKDGERIVFAETPPLPTYLLAFAAGRLDVVEVASRDRIFRIFHGTPDRDRVERNANTIVEQHAHAVEWLEEWTAVPYPFAKFDIVLIPSFQFAGMEHPGAVYYDADRLLMDANATQREEWDRTHLIAHETAHMWFGNLVTMAWFDDVWLKEVCANLLAAKIVRPMYPGIDHDLRFFVQHYPAAYDVDRTEGANPIRQPLDSLQEAGLLYGPIVYLKAPIALRHLERIVGEDAIRASLREYLSRYALAAASWPDLEDIVSKHVAGQVREWSRGWIEERGRPTLTTEWRQDSPGRAVLTVRQIDPHGRGLVRPQALSVVLGRGSGIEHVNVILEDDHGVVELPSASGRPDWTLLTGGGLAYGLVVLDDQTIGHLVGSLHTVPDALTRASGLVTLWEAMLDRQLPPAAMFECVLAGLESERDETVLTLLMQYVNTLVWRFTAADRRVQLAPRLEAVLDSGRARATTASGRRVWLAALQSVALTPRTVGALEDMWRHRHTTDGAPLSEADELSLTIELVVRLPDRADTIVATQVARTSDAHRRARLEFLAPVLSGDANRRAAAFEHLRVAARDYPESWTIEAARCLHHPARAEASAPLVVPALGLTDHIRRAGDIFFPKRWVDATLSGYQSAAVAREVADFIASLPADYPQRLRWLLLAAADPLFRAARLCQS